MNELLHLNYFILILLLTLFILFLMMKISKTRTEIIKEIKEIQEVIKLTSGISSKNNNQRYGYIDALQKIQEKLKIFS